MEAYLFASDIPIRTQKWQLTERITMISKTGVIHEISMEVKAKMNILM